MLVTRCTRTLLCFYFFTLSTGTIFAKLSQTLVSLKQGFWICVWFARCPGAGARQKYWFLVF